MSSQNLQSFLAGRVSVVLGDITGQNVNAIVNAANSTLLARGLFQQGDARVFLEYQEFE